jgi:hypothetical protein
VRGDVRDRPRGRDGARAGALPLAVAIVLAALAGCAGDSDDSASSPPTGTTGGQGTTSVPTTATTGGSDDGGQRRLITVKLRVRLALEAVLTSSDRADDACGRFVTKHYLRVAYGGRQGCVQAQVPGSAAKRFDLKDLRLSGDRATAVVVPSGGPYSGERLTVSVVNEGPRWAVDELESDVPVGP